MTLRLVLTLLLIVSSPGLSPSPVAFAQDASAQRAPRIIDITVEGGYHPDRVLVTEGEHVQLRVLRKEYSGCTLEIVFPTLGIRKQLPTNQAVLIDLGTPSAGEIPFHCGMNMIHGTVVVQPRG